MAMSVANWAAFPTTDGSVLSSSASLSGVLTEVADIETALAPSLFRTASGTCDDDVSLVEVGVSLLATSLPGTGERVLAFEGDLAVLSFRRGLASSLMAPESR
ncbi:hypothetical protein MTO96_038076 [Rhipicephalus appendiculatus]